MGPSMIIFLIILICIVIFGYIILVHLEVGVGKLFLIYIVDIDNISIELFSLKSPLFVSCTMFQILTLNS